MFSRCKISNLHVFTTQKFTVWLVQDLFPFGGKKYCLVIMKITLAEKSCKRWVTMEPLFRTGVLELSPTQPTFSGTRMFNHLFFKRGSWSLHAQWVRAGLLMPPWKQYDYCCKIIQTVWNPANQYWVSIYIHLMTFQIGHSSICKSCKEDEFVMEDFMLKLVMQILTIYLCIHFYRKRRVYYGNTNGRWIGGRSGGIT